VPTRYLVNPAGLFLGDQNFSSAYGNVAAFGIAESSIPIDTASVAKGTYLGFLFEAGSTANTTQLVGFGKVPSAGSVINGGTYPSEDPSLDPDTNMIINFGKQDTLNNGLYYRATLTLPVAPGTCTAKPGTDARGNPTCTYNAVAMVTPVNMVGSPNPPGTVILPYAPDIPPASKYVIYLTAFDGGAQKLLVLIQQ
jgi:hypothetical protein